MFINITNKYNIPGIGKPHHVAIFSLDVLKTKFISIVCDKRLITYVCSQSLAH